jgi:serine/threonine-protein kinase
MADVFLARRHGGRELVAVKCLRPSLARNPLLLQAFEGEAQLMARLSDPHIVRLLEAGEDHGTHFLAMEYAAGVSLADCIAALRARGTPPPLEAVAAVAEDLLGALHVAHQATDEHGDPMNLVHLDVTPENVIVCSSGLCKLTDFGIARSKFHHPPEGTVGGKTPYLAPEQLASKRTDHRADIWAGALVIYELASLQHPLAGKSDIDTLNRIGTAPIPPLASVRDDVPEALDGVLQLALTRPSEHRFETARAFRDAIRCALPLLGGRIALKGLVALCGGSRP